MFIPRKNIENLIKAFSILIKSEAKLMLVLCGKRGWGINSIQETINKLAIQDKITITGFVSDSELSVIYKNATVLVLPSFMEGFGFPLIEAMSFGIPVTGSNKGSIPEIIQDKRFLFNPLDINDMAERIRLALYIKKNNPEFAETLKQRALRFSKSNTCKKLQKLLFT
jgi:glycosyltransferase involved in cell wall biosynthesis